MIGGTTEGAMRPPRQSQIPRRLRRGAYLLPSLFTIGNMLLGFYAIVLGFRGADLGSAGLFQRAALLVFAAGLLDGLDGRIARMTGTDSDFGREYDSLADLLTFGVAPALLTYAWGLRELLRFGWLVPLFFVVCCATRLARFNIQVRVVDSRRFVGLPAPAAAGCSTVPAAGAAVSVASCEHPTSTTASTPTARRQHQKRNLLWLRRSRSIIGEPRSLLRVDT